MLLLLPLRPSTTTMPHLEALHLPLCHHHHHRQEQAHYPTDGDKNDLRNRHSYDAEALACLTHPRLHYSPLLLHHQNQKATGSS
eukprot:EC792672.1.p4 GENE.EC792672.1~~EC792672.1.p4  ORF type:complete len:84 (+),score=22.16 EC792672.1:115-366(+)